jgi:hypothetical protein
MSSTATTISTTSGVTNFPNATGSPTPTPRLFALHNDSARPMPQKIVYGAHTVLHIGGEEVHLIYPGPNHESGNILTYFSAQRLAAMTDVTMPGWAPYRAWGNADYMPGMLAARDAVLSVDEQDRG